MVIKDNQIISPRGGTSDTAKSAAFFGAFLHSYHVAPHGRVPRPRLRQAGEELSMKIDIAAISLDVKNFRHDQATTEREAIRFLLSDEKTHKVTELAQDIVEQRGMDPSSLLIVTEDPSHVGQYISLEGNRRVAALKTLMTPHLAVGTPGYAKFQALHQSFCDLKIASRMRCLGQGTGCCLDQAEALQGYGRSGSCRMERGGDRPQ